MTAATPPAWRVFKQLFTEHWDRFKHVYPRYDTRYYDGLVAKMLGCGNPDKMGSIEYRCQQCGEVTHRVAMSCKSSLCLRCAKVYVANWVSQVSQMLHEGVIYRHIVLTVPALLRQTFYQQSQALLSLFMRCGVRCLDDVFSHVSGTNLRGGYIVVIQTHGRNGQYNPHLHFLAASGGWDPQARQWHLLTMLRQTVKTREIHRLVDACYTRYREGVATNIQKGDVPSWCQSLATYLAKYVVSPPISLRRIDHYDGQRVTYHYRSHQSERVERETVAVSTFIGHMVQHVGSLVIPVVMCSLENNGLWRAKARARALLCLRRVPSFPGLQRLSSAIPRVRGRFWAAVYLEMLCNLLFDEKSLPRKIPKSLHDSLMARLDRLATVKALAQLGATLGREFPYELLQAVSPWDEATLQRGLHQLVEAALLYQRGLPPQATYRFKHALIQDVAYQSLLKSTRQQHHQRIAQVVEERFPEICATQPELLARHYTAAGCAEQAVVYWQRAGQHASDRLAHLETISHLRTGIALLTTLPETPERTQQALTLYIALGAALIITKGMAAPEVAQAYTQARALCQQVGEPLQLAPVLLGLWRFYLAQSQFHTVREIGDTLLHLARRTDDPALAVLAHYALGGPWLWLGALSVARRHLEDAIARYTPDQRRTPVFRMGHDLGVACRFYAAQTLWLLGYPAQALAHLHEALTLAHALAHPLSLAWVRCRAAIFFQFCRDVPAVLAQAEAAVALTTAQGATQWVAQGTVFRGWALAMQGQGEVGMAQVHQGITAVQAAGQTQFVPYLYTVLADVCAHLGHVEEALQALAEAHTLVEQHEERCWEAEVCRLRGVLLLRQPVP